MNWPREYDGYQRTAESTRTQLRRHRGAARREGGARPVAQAHVRRLRVRHRLPRPPRPRLHARRPGADRARDEEAAAGACLHCHASVIPTYRRLGRRRRHQGLRGARRADVRRRARRSRQDRLVEPDRRAARRKFAARRTARTRSRCVDCHDPKTMELRVTRPGFLSGIQALAAEHGADAAPAEHRALARRRPRASRTTRTSTPRARRCARSSAASATSSTTAARR